MSKPEYYRVVQWFTHCEHIDGEGPTRIWASRFPDGSEVLEFKETTCNGQEDYHICGILYRNSPHEEWRWERDETDEYVGNCMFSDAGTAAKIRQFFKDNPPPEEAIESREE